MVGGLSAGSGNRGRAIEELEIDEATGGAPRVLVHSRSYHDKVR